jgi:hypothetical protein
MKALPAFTAAFAAGVLLMASLAQAAPPQPVIQIPQHSGPGLDPNADQQMDPDLVKKLTPGHSACLGDGTGYVRARIRGALNVDLSWKDAQLACSGEARPDGSGLRVSFAGPGPGGKVLRLVFGVKSAREGAAGRELPTNLTVLLDGGRIFATQGDEKCTLDQLSQSRLPANPAGSTMRTWRIEAHGFCVAPANALAGTGRILVSRFDFAGRIEFSGRG